MHRAGARTVALPPARHPPPAFQRWERTTTWRWRIGPRVSPPADARLARLVSLLIFLSGWTAAPARAGNLAWTGNGPRAKSITQIVRDPLNPQRLWAASFGAGVYRSLDGGSTWTAYRSGLINTFVRCLAVQPRHPDSIFCGANDGAYLSVDGGVHWSQVLVARDTTDHSVRSIAIDPIRSGTVYAGTYGMGIWKTLNAGSTWTRINLGLANSFIRSIAIHPSMPETVFAGAGTGGGVQRSYNGGLQWNVHPVPDTTATTGAVSQIAFDPADPNRIYAAMVQKGVLRSRNGGTSWVRINNGLASINTRSLAIANGNRYVGTVDAGVFRAVMPNDSTWTAVNAGLANPTADALLAEAAVPATVWVGTDGAGIARSTDSGASWSTLDGGLLDTYGFSLAVRPSTHAIYVGTGFGDQFWASADAGTSWARSSYLFSHDSEHGVAVDPVAANTVYLSAYGAGVYRSNDDGRTWFDPDSLSNTLGNPFVRPLIAWPPQSGHLLVGTGNGVWESTDGGGHWAAKGGGLPASFSVRSLALQPGTPATIYAGSDVNGVYKLVDDGTSPWAAKNAGLKGLFVYDLLADDAAPSIVYAATDSGLFRTVNGGDNWAWSGAGLPAGTIRALAQDRVNTAALFCGVSGAGVFESVNGGMSWNVLGNPSTLPNLVVRSLAVDGSRTAIYAGTDGGVAAYSNYAIAPAAVEPEALGRRLSLAVAPNPARTRAIWARFSLPYAGRVRIDVFGLHGERIRDLEDQVEAAGAHAVFWDGRDREGRPAAPGLYFVRLEYAARARAARVVLLAR